MDKLATTDIADYFNSPWGQTRGLGDLVTVILSNAVLFAGIIMFILILGGGFGMLLGAGTNNPETAAKGKTVATGALIGFIVVFAAYWIIQIIEAITGVPIIDSSL